MEKQDPSSMEKVFTTPTFGIGMVVGSDGPIPMLVDEVANRELFSINNQMKKVIRNNLKRRIINLDSKVIVIHHFFTFF